MDVEEALEFADSLVFAETGKHLKDLQTDIFRQVWQGQTYSQIGEVSNYTEAHVKDEAYKLWKQLSAIFGEKVSQQNFQGAVERKWRSLNADARGEHSGELPPPEYTGREPCQDWGEAVDAIGFYGRTNELNHLEQWIVSERCRSVAILGMGGIGKTALTVKLSERVKHNFEFVLWRSLRTAPAITNILADSIEFFSNQQETDVPEDVERRISRLIYYLCQHRCLLILEDMQMVMSSGELVGNYKPGYEHYGELLKQVATSRHQSCLVLTSWEKPREVSVFSGLSLPVRFFSLQGLDTASAQQIFREKGLSEEDECEEIIKIYRGNPLALKIVAATIVDVFAGRVVDFLKLNTLFLGDFGYLLEQQFQRLSELEQDLIFSLAVELNPTSISKLSSAIHSKESTSALIQALESLVRRSLIEKVKQESETLFTLQPAMGELATKLVRAEPTLKEKVKLNQERRCRDSSRSPGGAVNVLIPFVISPRHTSILNPKPLLSWNAVPKVSNYKVVVEDERGNKMWDTQVMGTEVVYDGKPLQPGVDYSVFVEAQNGKSSDLDKSLEQGFRLLNADDTYEVQNVVNLLPSQKIPDEAAALLLAQLYMRYDLNAEAIEKLEESVSQGSQTVAVYRLLGDIYSRIGLNRLAGARYEKAVKLAEAARDKQGLPALQARLAEVYATRLNLKQAIPLLEKALAGYQSLGNTQRVTELQKRLEELNREK